MQNLLKDVANRAGTNVLSAIDYLDDGSPVSLSIIFFISLFYQIQLRAEIDENTQTNLVRLTSLQPPQLAVINDSDPPPLEPIPRIPPSSSQYPTQQHQLLTQSPLPTRLSIS